RVFDFVGGFLPAICFSPDHRLAYVRSSVISAPADGENRERSEGIDVLEVATGKRLRRLITLAGGSLENIGVSPDAKSVAFVTVNSSGRRDLVLCDAAGKERGRF